MPLITLHLFNSIERAEEVIINTDHIVSAQGANENSTNIQLTSGPTFRVAESVAELHQLVANSSAVAFPALETKEVAETAAEKKARLKAEADAAAAQQ